jgi:hypothetical protein
MNIKCKLQKGKLSFIYQLRISCLCVSVRMCFCFSVFLFWKWTPQNILSITVFDPCMFALCRTVVLRYITVEKRSHIFSCLNLNFWRACLWLFELLLMWFRTRFISIYTIWSPTNFGILNKIWHIINATQDVDFDIYWFEINILYFRMLNIPRCWFWYLLVQD